jgi:GNAT superfamily N-acetyltransferase
MLPRVATIEDVPLFRSLWMDFLKEQHELGHHLKPTEKNLDAFERLFRAYIDPTSKLPGVVLFIDDAAVFMAGSIGEVFESEWGVTAVGHGTYVVPDARRLGLSKAIRKAGFECLASLGFETATGASVQGNTASEIAAEKIGLRRYATQWIVNLKEK